MEIRAKKKEMDAEDRFLASIADEVRELPLRERLLAKMRSKIYCFGIRYKSWRKKATAAITTTQIILSRCFNKEIKWYIYQGPSIQQV